MKFSSDITSEPDMNLWNCSLVSISFIWVWPPYILIEHVKNWYRFIPFQSLSVSSTTLIYIFPCTGLDLRMEKNPRKPTYLANGWNNFESCWQVLEKCGMSVVFIFPIYCLTSFSALHCWCVARAQFDAGGCLLYLKERNKNCFLRV